MQIIPGEQELYVAIKKLKKKLVSEAKVLIAEVYNELTNGTSNYYLLNNPDITVVPWWNPKDMLQNVRFLTEKVDRVKIDGKGGVWVTMCTTYYRQAGNCCAAHTGSEERRKKEDREEKRQR